MIPKVFQFRKKKASGQDAYHYCAPNCKGLKTAHSIVNHNAVAKAEAES